MRERPLGTDAPVRGMVAAAARLPRAVWHYYAGFWLPLLLSELAPVSQARRLALRRHLRPAPPDEASQRARELKLLLLDAALAGAARRSRPARHVGGILFAALMALAPLVEIPRALRANQRFGAIVRRRFGIARTGQVLQMLDLALCEPETFGFIAGRRAAPAYYGDHMFLDACRRQAHLYLTSFAGLSSLANLLAFDPGLMAWRQPKAPFTKLWIAERFRAAAIPTIETIAVGGRGKLTYEAGYDALPPIDLFVKPNLGRGGDGATRWTWTGAAYRSHDGRTRSPDELAREIVARHRTIVVQPCLDNHPDIARLCGKTLATVRLHTILDRDGTPVLVPDPFVKLPLLGAVVDNLHIGGPGAPVDPVTGTLKPANGRDFAPITTHPDTGARFAGVSLPCWRQVRDLALRAHEALKPAVVVGFDIAILADGPVVVEANAAPVTSEGVTGIPMATYPELDLLIAHVRRLTATRADA